MSTLAARVVEINKRIGEVFAHEPGLDNSLKDVLFAITTTLDDLILKFEAHDHDDPSSGVTGTANAPNDSVTVSYSRES